MAIVTIVRVAVPVAFGRAGGPLGLTLSSLNTEQFCEQAQVRVRSTSAYHREVEPTSHRGSADRVYDKKFVRLVDLLSGEKKSSVSNPEK